MSRTLLAAATLVLILAVADYVAAQTGDGSLRGYVRDELGSVLPGVTVTATSSALLNASAAVTDSTGYYRLISLPPGTYTLTAELTGFAVFKREGILLRAGSTFQVDVVMQVGTLEETITVVGDSPMLEVSRPSNTLNIDGEFQREVPLQARRNWSNFLEVSPGVNSLPHDDGSGRMTYYGHGVDLFAHVVQLDGMMAHSNVNPQITHVGMGADMIQDTQVKTGGVDASAPMGTGVVVNVVSKSGGNQFRGSAAYAYQPLAWNDDNTPPTKDAKFAGTPPISRVNIFDAGLGGPIRHDRVWFFSSVRYQNFVTGIGRTPREVEILKSFFPDIQLFNNESYSWQPFLKITARATDRHEFNVLYNADRAHSIGSRSYHYDPVGEVYSSGGAVFGGQLSSLWGANVTTTFRVSYNNKRGNELKTYERWLRSGPDIIIHENAFPQAGRAVGTGRLVEGGNFQSILRNPGSMSMIRGDLTWFKSGWGGSHEFQSGFFLMPSNRDDRETEYLNDGFILEERRQINLTNPNAGSVPFHRQYVDPLRLETRAARDRDYGIYIQDLWKPTARLTANAGLRVDFVKRYDKIFDIVRQASTEIAPRLGFSYLVTKDAKNVLRGSYGRIHEQVTGRDNVTAFGGTSRVSTRDEYDLDGDGRFESVIFAPAVTAQFSSFQFDPDISQPYVDEFILGFRKQFPWQIALDVAGITRKYKKTYALIDINGFYPDRPGQPFQGFGRIDPNRGILQQQTNNTWSALNYTALEITAAKNLSRGVQFVVAVNRQWQHMSGTWNPTDPARFIQPDAFANNKMLPMARGNNENDSYTQLGTYGPTWLKYSMRFGGTWFAPHGFVIAPSLIVQAGPWSGPILDRLDANDPRVTMFGPPTVLLPNGTRVSNPLATNIRFVGKNRGDGQVLAPAIKTLGLKIGKTLKPGGGRELVLSGSIFNALNDGHFYQFSFSGANQVFNPNYLQMFNLNPPRALQVEAVFRY